MEFIVGFAVGIAFVLAQQQFHFLEKLWALVVKLYDKIAAKFKKKETK